MVDKTSAEFKSLDEISGGDIRIGCAESAGMNHFIKSTRALQKKHPNIRFHFYSSASDAITERIEKGLLDLAVIVKQVDLFKYNYLTVPHSDRWGILTRADDPLATQKSVTVTDLQNLPLIVSRQGMQEALLDWFGEQSSNLHIAATYDLLFNTTIMVRENLGYPLGFDGLVNTGTDSDLRFIPLEPALHSPMHIIWKKYQVFTPVAKLLLAELKECM
ncbi:LysR family transcriptional regulator substrate-binding protein [Listeria costaricensis]|uniref:LysR family transcriptional regulator substrate-binding protein n=1 Tax=Listeria costaricensis TaxID=2026604 RepID=UPI000C07A4A4|nr:LysR family transcriptional regulator substrate-binding protein [Listeria costaricensis]